MKIKILNLWQSELTNNTSRGFITKALEKVKKISPKRKKNSKEEMFGQNSEKSLVAIMDLQGNPYKFYRGKGYNPICVGRFFCSSFDQAKSFCIENDEPIIEAEIAVRNPLVIDATEGNGYSYYERLEICNCKLYPIDKREELIQYAKNHCFSATLSTDEVGEWARRTSDIDAVIVKNVIEGNDTKLPVYDIYIWNEENILRAKNIVHDKQDFELFRENTFKRVDLSSYIEEAERDGWVTTTVGEGYVVEHRICRQEGNWYMENELVVKSNTPIKIYCCNFEKYMTADFMDPGLYVYSHRFSQRNQFTPNCDTIRIRGVRLHEKYKIFYV